MKHTEYNNLFTLYLITIKIVFMAKKDKKKAGKRMKKAQLADLMMSLFQTKSGEVLNLKYIFAEFVKIVK